MTEIDYAIVGGGVAGTYCAWRLKKKYPQKNIVLFEYSNRIGGRLLTIKFDGIDVNAELGGMRFNPEEHKLFDKVRKLLGLHEIPFPMGTKADPAGENNIAYFRQKHFRIKELTDSSKVPFKIGWSQKNHSPDQVQEHVMRMYVPNYQDLKNAKDWGEVNVFGKKLYQFGFWNLLYRVLSPDEYLFLKYGSGYDTNVSNGSAAVLLPTGSEYTPEGDSTGGKFLTLENGMESLPKTLANQFKEKYKGTVLLNHRLHSIKRKDEKYELRFFKTEPDENKETWDVDADDYEDFVAEHIILGMPRAALEQIEWDQWDKDDFLRENLSSVLNQPAIKILLAYDYAWWKSLGMVYGRSITDLPIRQTLYFTSPDDTDLKKISNKPALLLASYNDIETIPFWKGLEKGDKFDGPKGYQASEAMVTEAHEQIEEIHDIEELPKPIAAAFYDWSKLPFGAGWHCWKANCKFWEVTEDMRHPVKSEKVYICGDAYSLDQGWAEGALETAELVLTKELDESQRLESIMDKDWQPLKRKRRR